MRRRYLILTVCLFGFGGLAWNSMGLTDEPHPGTGVLALNPQNPHYFQWRGKPTVLVTSGEHYGAVLNLDFDYHRYLATLQRDGLNLTRTFSGVYREPHSAFGITENTLAPKPNRYVCPWQRSDVDGYHDGGNKFDLTRWDEAYFQRLRDFVGAAARAGVVVEMNLFCPMYKDEMWLISPMNTVNNVNGIGGCVRTDVYTLKHAKLLSAQLAVTRKIVRELNSMENVYFEVCNEPYFGGVTMEWQHRIAEEIKRTEAGLPNQHLISLNIANGRKKVVDPHAAISIFNFHYCYPPDVVPMNFGLNKVIGENETGFRGRADVLYRTEAWDFILAGGGLYNNLDYSFTASYPDGTRADYKSPGGGSPQLRQQLGILKTFMEGMDFVTMQPAPDFVRESSPGLTTHTLARSGQAYAVYLHRPVPKKIKAEFTLQSAQQWIVVDLPKGRYRVHWTDPLSGKITTGRDFDHRGGQRRLRTPTMQVDLGLKIEQCAERG